MENFVGGFVLQTDNYHMIRDYGPHHNNKRSQNLRCGGRPAAMVRLACPHLASEHRKHLWSLRVMDR